MRDKAAEIDAMGPMQRLRVASSTKGEQNGPVAQPGERRERCVKARVTVESMVTDDSQGWIVSLTNRSIWLFSWAMPSLALRS